MIGWLFISTAAAALLPAVTTFGFYFNFSLKGLLLPHSGISVFAGEFLFLGEVRSSDFPLAGVAAAGVMVDVSFFFPGDLSFATFGVDIGALVSLSLKSFLYVLLLLVLTLKYLCLFFFSGALFLPFAAFGVDVGALVSVFVPGGFSLPFFPFGVDKLVPMSNLLLGALFVPFAAFGVVVGALVSVFFPRALALPFADVGVGIGTLFFCYWLSLSWMSIYHLLLLLFWDQIKIQHQIVP
jgi:hypothetical protein